MTGRVVAFALACLVAVATGAAPAPQGASALDALAAWRRAESQTYRLAEDGVTTFSCRLTGQFLTDVIPGPSEVRFWWRDGRTRVTVQAAGMDAESREKLGDLLASITDLVLPRSPSRALGSHSVRFLDADPWLRVGERGLEAIARDDAAEPRIARVALGAGGLLTREWTRRQDGEISEFTHEHARAGDRTVLAASRGTFRGAPAAFAIDWGAVVAGRPVPTRVMIEQGDKPIVLVLTDIRLNEPIPDTILAPTPVRPGLPGIR